MASEGKDIIVPYIIRENEPTKETEPKTVPTLETKLQNSSVQKGSNVSDGAFEVSLEKKLQEFNLSKLNHGINNDVRNTKHDSFIQELTFDSLPDDALITIKPSKPIHNIALFISFNYDLSNHLLQQECNARGFHALFRDVQDHVNIAPIAKLITDIVINCWTYNWNIIVFITSEPILPINAVTALLKKLRVYFDLKALEIIIIWPNVYERSRDWVDTQCRIAKATACIQGFDIPDIVPKVMSYFDKEANSTTDEKKITCYHEFNISYPAAMEIDDKIWLDAKQYFEITKSIEINSHDRIVLLESILRKALYNKFSQDPRLKYTLLSTRIASVEFTEETCKCSLYNRMHSNSKNVVKNDPKILKTRFIDILEEVRCDLMQKEKERIELECKNLTNGERSLFLFDFA